jgi:hypothetical protein
METWVFWKGLHLVSALIKSVGYRSPRGKRKKELGIVVMIATWFLSS